MIQIGTEPQAAKAGEGAVENATQPANCGGSLPDKNDPQYFKKQLEMDKCGCGEVCVTNKAGQPGKYFNFVPWHYILRDGAHI